MEISELNLKNINQPRANPIDSLIQSLQNQLILYSSKAQSITDLDKEIEAPEIKNLKAINKISLQSLINEDAEFTNEETSSETIDYNPREDLTRLGSLINKRELTRLEELIEGRKPIDNVQELQEVIAVLQKLKRDMEINTLKSRKSHFWDRSQDMRFMANFFKDNKVMLNNALDWLSYYNRLYGEIEID